MGGTVQPNTERFRMHTAFLQNSGSQPSGCGPVPVHGLIGTGPHKKYLFPFYLLSEQSFSLKNLLF